MKTGLGPHCTPDCQVIERWMGGTLYSERVIHRHGPAAWGGYDAEVLGLCCPHDDCQPRREAGAA